MSLQGILSGLIINRGLKFLAGEGGGYENHSQMNRRCQNDIP